MGNYHHHLGGSMTQKALVLKALQKGQKLTPLEALNKGMGMRLGAHIHKLRQQGYDIRRNLVKRGPSRVAQYYLAS
jgi:biotin operon repressor